MPIELKMPALSPTMEEGTLAKWLVKEGDKVASGDILAEIETDKATMEFEAVDEGTLAKILVPEGSEGVKVGAPIAILAGEGEDASAAAAAPKADTAAPPPPKAAAEPKADATPKVAPPAQAPVETPAAPPQPAASSGSRGEGFAARAAACAGTEHRSVGNSGQRPRRKDRSRGHRCRGRHRSGRGSRTGLRSSRAGRPAPRHAGSDGAGDPP